MTFDFYNSKQIKRTRKDHRCHLCGLTIPKGVDCIYEAGKCDGDFFSRHAHNECAKKWIDMNRDEPDGDWYMFEDSGELGLQRKLIVEKYELDKTEE